MKPFRILIVDDDADDFFIVQQAFAKLPEKNVLVHISNGQQLIEYLEASDHAHHHLADLVLLDINMPKMSGIDALGKIKQNPNLNHIPIIIYTTSASADDIEQCRQLKADGFVTKASEFSETVSLVKDIYQFLTGAAAIPGSFLEHNKKAGT